MPSWAWVLIGVALLAGEILTPGGFYLLFFGVGALLVGALELAGVALPVWGEWALFTVFSVASTMFFRAPLLRWIESRRGASSTPDIVDEIAAPIAAIAAGAVGRAELRGTVWSARNGAQRDLAAGERCRVSRVDGLQITLVPE